MMPRKTLSGSRQLRFDRRPQKRLLVRLRQPARCLLRAAYVRVARAFVGLQRFVLNGRHKFTEHCVAPAHRPDACIGERLIWFGYSRKFK